MASSEDRIDQQGELESNLEFIQGAKEGQYAAIDLDSLNYLRIYEGAEHINLNEKDYYFNFV